MKSVRRNNPRAEQMRNLRRQRLPASAHVPVADRLNTTEAKIKKEIAIMKKLRHPHVVRLYEVIDDRMKEKIYMSMSSSVSFVSGYRITTTSLLFQAMRSFR